MKKLLIIGLFSALITACGADEQNTPQVDGLAELRKMTVGDWLENDTLLSEVNDKCDDREIKDAEICETVKEAINNNHNFW